MTRNKPALPKRGDGDYRTLVVPVERDAAPPMTPIMEDIGVPETIREQMARLDLADLDTETDTRRRDTAVAETAAQQALVDYFDGLNVFSDDLVDIYLEETRSDRGSDLLILDYLNQGNRCLQRLICAAIDRHPTDKGLLYDLAYLEGFIGQPLTVIDRYCQALVAETAWPRLRAMAEDICDHEPLLTPASRARFRQGLQDYPEKWQLLDNAMQRHG